MKEPLALTTTAPLLVVADPVNVNASLLASVAVTVPVTTPVEAFGEPTVGAPATGTAFDGLIVTVTGTATEPPNPSVTITVNESVFTAAEAPVAAAAWRAAAVGV